VRPAAFWTFSLIAVALCAAVEICPRLVRHRQLARQALTLAAGNDVSRQINERLAAQVEALDNDPFYVEQMARRDLGFHRPGEQRLRMGKLYVPAPSRRDLPPEPWPWMVRLERIFSYDSDIRRAALVTAAALLLSAFLFFPVYGRRDERPEPAEELDPIEEVILPPQRKAG
jgi:septum formation initiator